MLRYRVWILIFGAVLASVAVACGNPATTAQQTQTAQALAATPTPAAGTPAPLATPPSPPQVSGRTPATPVTVAPLTAGMAGARTDCPAGWVTWRDVASVLSLCTPTGMFAVSDVRTTGGAITVATELNGKANTALPSVAISAGVSSHSDFSAAVPLSQRCRTGEIPGQVSGDEIHMTVAGQTAQGCHYVGDPSAPGGPTEGLHIVAALPVAPGQAGRFLSVIDNWGAQSPGAKALAYQILGTIRVEK